DLIRVAPFALIAAVLTLVNIYFQQKLNPESIRNVSASERLADPGFVVWFYLSKAWLPLNLSFFYPQPTLDPTSALSWLPFLAVIIVTALLICVRRSPGGRSLLFAWAFFCIALAPVMGVLDVPYMKFSLVADHYQYLAILAVVAQVSA